MIFIETKAFVMQVPASLAHTVEHMAATRGYPVALVVEQALREWIGRQGNPAIPCGQGRLAVESLAELAAARVAAREEIAAWAAPLDADA